MGFLKNLFLSRQEKQRTQRELARRSWASALQSSDREAMETAASNLSLADLDGEYLAAMKLLIAKFPAHACTYENSLGVHYYFNQQYELALTHYVRSYNLDEPGGCAESNILEVCHEMSREAASDREAVGHLMRYFKVCTRQVGPDATLEEIDLLSPFRANVRSLADEQLEEAENAYDEIADLLAQIDDDSFVASTRQELDRAAKQLGIVR